MIHCPYCYKPVLKSVGRPPDLFGTCRDHIARSILQVLTTGSSASDTTLLQALPAMSSFGDFKPLCESTPSYPWCNIFYRQVFPRVFKSTRNQLTPASPTARKKLTSFTNRSFCGCGYCPSGHQPGMWYPQGRRGGFTGEYRQHDCLRPQYDCRRLPHYQHYSKEGRGRYVSFSSFTSRVLQSTHVSPLLQVVRNSAFSCFCTSFLCRFNSSQQAPFCSKDHYHSSS